MAMYDARKVLKDGGSCVKCDRTVGVVDVKRYIAWHLSIVLYMSTCVPFAIEICFGISERGKSLRITS